MSNYSESHGVHKGWHMLIAVSKLLWSELLCPPHAYLIHCDNQHCVQDEASEARLVGFSWKRDELRMGIHPLQHHTKARVSDSLTNVFRTHHKLKPNFVLCFLSTLRRSVDRLPIFSSVVLRFPSFLSFFSSLCLLSSSSLRCCSSASTWSSSHSARLLEPEAWQWWWST